jgi:hypothetical protein
MPRPHDVRAGTARAARSHDARRESAYHAPMKKLIWIAAALALVACSKKGDNAAKSGEASACTTAAAKAVASLPAADGAGTDVKAKLQSIYAKRCAEDKWSAEVVQCYETAAGMQGLQACRAKLPPELGTKLRNEIMAAMAGAAAGMGGAPMGHGGGAGAPGGEPSGAGGAPGAGGDPAGGGAAGGTGGTGGTAPGGDPPAAGGAPK